MPKMQCIVVTPEITLRDAGADFVAVSLYDGELGIGENHSPMIGRLGNGEMRITHEGKVERYYVEGGFIEVKDNVISLLTQRAVPAESLNVAVAMEQIETAGKRPANTPELMAIRDRAVSQARAQLRVAQRASQ
ncbi:MAG: F0F1 ATP synthase subunit epsilon [Planctomycetota bacterium]|nr:F0F1 ATP synthase subunit epsilon [Planctomycetota bacterium]